MYAWYVLGGPSQGFGGIASGPDVLKTLHDVSSPTPLPPHCLFVITSAPFAAGCWQSLDKVLLQHCGQRLSITGIVDIMNLIGK